MVQAAGHVGGDSGGQALRTHGKCAGVIFIHYTHEGLQPTLEILGYQGALTVKLAVDVHRVPLVVSVTQQQLTPIVLDVGEMDVEVNGEIISNMFGLLNQWHETLGADNLVVVNTNRSPDVVIADILNVMGLSYDVFAS